MIVTGPGGRTESIEVPLAVSLQSGSMQPATVAGSDLHALAVRGDGSVLAWGANGRGELGTGPELRDPRIGAQVRRAPHDGTRVVVSSSDSWVLGTDGIIRGWTPRFRSGANAGLEPYPTIESVFPDGVVSMAAGSRLLLILRQDGALWYYPAVVEPVNPTTWRMTARPVPGLDRVIAIQSSLAGRGRALAVREDGTVWAIDATRDLAAVESVAAITGVVQVPGLTTARAATCGQAHCLALLADGTVAAWGDNAAGQLGDGTRQARTEPAVVPGLSGVRAIAAADWFSLAVTDDGRLWQWSMPHGAPLRPIRRPELTDAREVTAGESVALVRGASGSVWSVGMSANANVARGDGPIAAFVQPVRLGTVPLN